MDGRTVLHLMVKIQQNLVSNIPVLGWLQGRCLPLMIAVLGLLIIYPIFEVDGTRPGLSMRLLFSAVPIIAVFTVSTHRWTMVTAFVLVGFIIALEWGPELGDGRVMMAARSVAAIVFYVFCTFAIIRSVFIHHDTLKDHPVYGGITAYLMMGLSFSMMYQFVFSLNAGAFVAHPDIHGHDHVITWSDFIYFSFITLTTVGYGDVIPSSNFTRGLAVLESIAGVLYVAVLIAQLVIDRRLSGDCGSGVSPEE